MGKTYAGTIRGRQGRRAHGPAMPIIGCGLCHRPYAQAWASMRCDQGMATFPLSVAAALPKQGGRSTGVLAMRPNTQFRP